MKTQLIFAAMVVIGLLLSGCGDPEEKARALYNEAMVEQRDGNVEQARSLYEKIIEKYPTTEIAVKIEYEIAADRFQDVTSAERHVRKLVRDVSSDGQTESQDIGLRQCAGLSIGVDIAGRRDRISRGVIGHGDVDGVTLGNH